jgi:heptosyltransferase III
VLCGAPEEWEVSDYVSKGWEATAKLPVLNLCGKLSPRESAAVLERAQLFIGHDSGPGHLAAAVRTPCVSVFGSHCLPGVWFPYGKRNRILYHLVDCAGCRLKTCIEQKKKCILSITVDEVMTQIEAALQPEEPTVSSRRVKLPAALGEQESGRFPPAATGIAESTLF